MHLDDLACKTACHDVLVRFCTALDTRDNVAAADLFADDAQMVAPSGDTVHGTAIRAYFERRPTALITRHIMTNVLVEPTGPDTASARAYILVYRVQRQDPDRLPRAMPSGPQGAGDWVVDLRRTDAGWRISRYEGVPILEPAASG